MWFFTLSLGAAKLSTTLSKPRVRQVIDMAVAARQKSGVNTPLWYFVYSKTIN
ncbi:Lysine efflux permease [Vibrio cholerae]|nr:Lysine efflux permease [Vibrio cholerae]